MTYCKNERKSFNKEDLINKWTNVKVLMAKTYENDF